MPLSPADIAAEVPAAVRSRLSLAIGLVLPVPRRSAAALVPVNTIGSAGVAVAST